MSGALGLPGNACRSHAVPARQILVIERVAVMSVRRSAVGTASGSTVHDR